MGHTDRRFTDAETSTTIACLTYIRDGEMLFVCMPECLAYTPQVGKYSQELAHFSWLHQKHSVYHHEAQCTREMPFAGE